MAQKEKMVLILLLDLSAIYVSIYDAIVQLPNCFSQRGITGIFFFVYLMFIYKLDLRLIVQFGLTVK